MSYILDALRKAERDRHLGRTPSLGEVTQTPARRAGPGLSPRPLILLGVVLGLAVLTAVFWPRAQHAAAVAAPARVAALPTPAMVPASVPPPAAPVVEAAASPAALDASVPAESMDDLVEEPATPGAATSAAAEPDDAATSPAMDHAAAGDTAAEAEETATAEASAEPEPKLQPPSAAAVGVTTLRDMPDAYRADFPEFRVDVHVYDEDPARRWTMIDGNKYVEGATLPQGPRIVAISVDGLVLDYHGQTVLFPLRR